MGLDDFGNTMPDSRERRRRLQFLPSDMVADRYEYVRELGRGGMGVVMLCLDKMAGNREMAVKTVPEILSGNESAVADLTREYNIMYDLTHDGIVAVRNLVKDEFRYYVVMDYAKGETLEKYLGSHRKPGLLITCDVVHRLAVALCYAHSKGMIHLDVKPANVIVQIDGSSVKSVKLLDLGLGRQIRKSIRLTTGNITASGTPAYMSPEQWSKTRYGDVSPMSDQYSLAVLAYEMLSGAFPFAECDDLQVFRLAVLDEKELPERIRDVSGYVNDALLKALSKKPENRFENCLAFAKALSTAPSDSGQKEVELPPVITPSKRPIVVEVPFPLPSAIKTPPITPSVEKDDMVLMLPGNVRLELVPILAGNFVMGSPKDEEDRENYETQHQVTLTRDYWLGRFPITQGQWKAIMGSNPSLNSKGDNFPVGCVSWNDARNFCRKLNEAVKPSGLLPTGYEFMLPTEAQWEYAARGGHKSNGYHIYSGGNDVDEVAWWDGTSNQQTHPVGQKKPNELGLYDMSGNVAEWCSDKFDYEDYPHGAVKDPKGPSSGSSRVLRGGSWRDDARRCRSAYRYSDVPTDRYYNLGFRVALASVQ